VKNENNFDQVGNGGEKVSKRGGGVELERAVQEKKEGNRPPKGRDLGDGTGD